jgi:hypothetical protein
MIPGRSGLFMTLGQQELYEFLVEAKNEWNRRYEEQPPVIDHPDVIPIIDGKRMKKAYLHFEDPITGKPQ